MLTPLWKSCYCFFCWPQPADLSKHLFTVTVLPQTNSDLKYKSFELDNHTKNIFSSDFLGFKFCSDVLFYSGFLYCIALIYIANQLKNSAASNHHHHLLIFPLRLFDLCPQFLPTASTGSWPATTPVCPSCTPAPTSCASSTSTSPGSSAARASCPRRRFATPRTWWSAKELTCRGWSSQIRRAAGTTRDRCRPPVLCAVDDEALICHLNIIKLNNQMDPSFILYSKKVFPISSIYPPRVVIADWRETASSAVFVFKIYCNILILYELLSTLKIKQIL